MSAYRLVELHKRRGLTQVEVAAAMDVGQSWVSKLERGDVEATGIATLRDYLRALGGDVEVGATLGDERVVLV